MSGLEILGAVAASVELTTLCVTIGKRLQQIKLDISQDLPTEIIRECDILISAINEQILQLATDHDHLPAVHQLAERLQKVKQKVETRSRRKYLLRAVALLVGYEGEYREMMDALGRYQAASMLSLHATLAKILSIQDDIPKSLERVKSGLTAMQEELRKAAHETKGVPPADESCLVHSLRDEIVDVIKREFRNFQSDSSRPIRDLNASLAFDQKFHMDRGELSLEYGAMADYLQDIWTNGGYTTDQDVWGCFIDIFEVYKDPKLCRSLRQVSLDGKFASELFGKLCCDMVLIVVHLGLFKRQWYVRGAQRFRWIYEVYLLICLPSALNGRSLSLLRQQMWNMTKLRITPSIW